MSYKTNALFLFLLLIITFTASAANYHNIHAKVFLDTKPQWNQFYSLHLDVVSMEGNRAEIITSQAQLDELAGLGFRTEVVISDIEKFVKSRLDGSRPMGGYMTLSEINAHLDGMVTDHPDITTKVDIGQTLEGRTMWAVKISDNPELDEDETEVLFTAAIHAREVITPLVLLNVMDSLTDRYASNPDIQYLVDNREMWFVIPVNPDGYYYNEVIVPGGGGMWRKNRRDNGDGSWGIDLNRNYGYNWGYDDVGSSPDGYDETYRGTGPFSEPESQNMRDFSIAHDFKIAVYYHSYSNLILWPWGYDRSETPDEHLYRGLGDSISAFNGYVPTYIQTLYPVNGGTTDWHYGDQTVINKTFAFTIEIGTQQDYFWPPTYRIPDLVNENYFSTLFLADASDHIEEVLPPNAPQLILADTVDNSWYQVEWSHEDPFNPAVDYELVEYQGISEMTDPGDNFDNFNVDGFSIGYSRYHSGYSSFYSGMYAANFFGYLAMRNPVPIGEGDVFRFWTFYRIEDGYDYAYVHVSTDGVNWSNLEGNITTADNPNGLNQGNGITGNSGGWVQAEFDMADYAGQIVYLAFSYHTDASLQEEGIYFDDIEMVTNFDSETIVSSTIEDLSYTFVDRPDGTDFYYKVRARDTDLQWGTFSPILRTHARIPFVCGDLDDSGEINILDIVYLINYIYKNGPAPEPLISADVDHDGNINILDIVYLINFIYKSGPAPDCP